MFSDLVERAKLKREVIEVEKNRKKEVQWMFKDFVKEIVPEIESLGFVKVTFSELKTRPSFYLRIQVKKGYDSDRHTFNLELASLESAINYGYGANSACGKQIYFDYNWNNSKLIATMKNALRALVSDALERK